MLRKSSLAAAAALAVSVGFAGCTGQMVQTSIGPMPDYCLGNNAATGAVVGALFGAALGAAAGGGRGAAIGAASGAALGGLTGAQVDAQCRQLAEQRALEMAWARQAAMAAQQAQGPGAPPPSYEPVDYVNSEGRKKQVRVTSLNSYTDPASKRVCRSAVLTEFDPDARSTADLGSRRECQGGDGKWTAA